MRSELKGRKAGYYFGINIPLKVAIYQYQSFPMNIKVDLEDYCRALRKAKAPCQPVLTPGIMKILLPSLKPVMNHRVRCQLF